jgi:hypothetical protein
MKSSQYSKLIIIESIRDTRKKIKLFMKTELQEEHRNRFILADEKLSEAIQWLKARGK